MLPAFDARFGKRRFDIAASIAAARPTEADTPDDDDTLVCVIETDADGTYHERMEHERQARLRRWQRQPNAAEWRRGSASGS